MCAGADERLHRLVGEALGPAAEPLGVEFPAVRHRDPQNGRGHPAIKPALLAFGVGVADRGVESPLREELPAKRVGRRWLRAPDVASHGREGLHDGRTSRYPALLVGHPEFTAVEEIRLIATRLVGRRLTDFDGRDDAAPGVLLVVEAKPPFEPFADTDPHEQFGEAVRCRHAAIVDPHIRSLSEHGAHLRGRGRGCEGVAIGVEFSKLNGVDRADAREPGDRDDGSPGKRRHVLRAGGHGYQGFGSAAVRNTACGQKAPDGASLRSGGLAGLGRLGSPGRMSEPRAASSHPTLG